MTEDIAENIIQMAKATGLSTGVYQDLCVIHELLLGKREYYRTTTATL